MLNKITNRSTLVKLLLLICLPFILVFLNIIINDWRAYWFARQLHTIPLPSQTELISIRGSNEKYPARRDCIVYGQALFKTKLSLDEIEDFYLPILNKTVKLQNPILSTSSLKQPLLDKFGPQWRISKPTEHFNDLLKTNTQENTFAQLTLASMIMPSYLDVRCW